MTDRNNWADHPKSDALPRATITVLRKARMKPGGRAIFNVATIERAAVRLADAPGERPLLGRLRYLRTMDFPSPVAKGRGKKADMDLDETVQTLFALELMHAGIVPTRAIRILRTDWAAVKAAIAYGWARANGLGSAKRPHRWLVLEPSILSELGRDERADEPLNEIRGILTLDDIAGLRDRGNGLRRAILIDAEAFAVDLAAVADPFLGITRNNFDEEMRAFCGEAFETADPSQWVLAGATSKAA